MADEQFVTDPKSRNKFANAARVNETHKLCPHCGVVKSKGEFGKSRDRNDGVKVYCRPCHNARNKAARERSPESSARSSARWQKSNPDKAAAKRKRFLERKGPEYFADRAKAWRERNPEQHRNSVARARKRLAACPNYRLRKRFSEAVRLSFQNGKETKGVFRLLGYTFSQLKTHLERQFVPGMTWENRGDWHIDHIVPLASFKITSADSPEFHRAWALSNLRPIWKRDNLRKHARRIYLI